MRRLGGLFAGLALLCLAACRVGPEYRRPELVLPGSFSAGPHEGSVPDAWWTLFGDADLDRLVQEALAANQDLAAAAARVEQAQALVGIVRSEQFPELSGSAGASRRRFSEETAQLPPEAELETDTFDATLNVSYAIDFWGRLRRASEAVRAELLASEEGRKSVRLALVAGVAAAYFDLLAFDRQLAWAGVTLASRRESVRLQGLRFDAGTISELDLAQAQSELAATEATLPVIERQRRQTEDRLAVLLGRTSGEVVRTEGLESVTLPDVPVGLPSELLARRPDIVAAEQRLVAANARIGVARGALFPSIPLTGYAGSESDTLAGLFGPGTGVWQAALGLVQPIFNAGRLRREVTAASAREREALALYAKTVQSAFAEVEDALVARRTGAAEREALAQQVEALTRALRLATLRYEAGESSYLEVLDAERNLFRAELSLTLARRSEFVAAVALFQALGGGWER